MANLIKGYLPIRISLPSTADEGTEETFMFLKEHTSAAESAPRTLFVTNTPIYQSIQTKILLQALFEKYADVEKILVAPKPKKDFEDEREASIEELTLSMFEKEVRGFEGTVTGKGVNEQSWYDQGRYAHVVFATTKDMKRFMNNFGKKKKKKGDPSPVIKFGKLAIQELQDISQKLHRNEEKKKMKLANDNDSGESDNDDSEGEEEEKLEGMMALVEAHKKRIIPRDALKQMCDKIMENYEESEAEALRKQQRAMNEPDEDGFVTVSYSTNVGDAADFEKNGNLGSTGVGGGRRKRERTRSSKKNLTKGSDELDDFYRFQLRESKKRNLEQLKTRFQEDLKRVKQMSDDKKYRPF
jgi:ribosomal RNA-processing protein 7